MKTGEETFRRKMGWYIVTEDKGLRFSQNFGTYQPKYTASHLHITPSKSQMLR